MDSKDSDNIAKIVKLLEKISAQLTVAGYGIKNE